MLSARGNAMPRSKFVQLVQLPCRGHVGVIRIASRQHAGAGCRFRIDLRFSLPLVAGGLFLLFFWRFSRQFAIDHVSITLYRLFLQLMSPAFLR
jgi:hypothetical protein